MTSTKASAETGIIIYQEMIELTSVSASNLDPRSLQNLFPWLEKKQAAFDIQRHAEYRTDTIAVRDCSIYKCSSINPRSEPRNIKKVKRRR